MGRASAVKPLSREVMLRGMLSADPAFDGQFITGVTTTGIYCLPSCRARKPKAQNVVFYLALAQAKAAGLRPCQRCKPDDFYAGVNTQEADLLRACQQLDLTATRNLHDLARTVGVSGVSQSTLQALFRTYFHRAPADWLSGQRIEKARHLLLSTDRQVAEVAFEVGFSSLSTFNEQFRRRCGLPPLALRDLKPGGFTLELPRRFNVPMLLRDLGRDGQHATLRVQGSGVQVGVRLPSGYLPGGPRLLELHFGAGAVRVGLHHVRTWSPEEALSLHTQVLRMLGWHSETRRFEAAMKRTPALFPLLAGQEGVRLPLTPDPFDGLVWAVLGQQITFKSVCTVRRRLLERVSEPLSDGLYAPPLPQAIAALSLNDAQSLGLTRARADLLIRTASLVATGALDLPALANGTAPRAEKTLRTIPGIGPWTAQYVLLRALGFQDALPVGDSALSCALQNFFDLPHRPDARKTAELMQPFAPYRSLATFHLWQRTR